MSKLKDIDLLNYIINQGKTAKEAAEFFDVSLSTVRKRLASIKSDLSKESNIHQDLESIAKKNEQEGKVLGGLSKNSGKKKSLTLEEIRKIAFDMLSQDLTIEEAANKYLISKSTLADNLEILRSNDVQLYQDLKSLFEAHILRRKTTNLQAKYSANLLDSEEIKKNKS